jgi:hypothetical protein
MNRRKTMVMGLEGRLSKHAPVWERIRELHDARFGDRSRQTR